jgi:hypothetical protein
MARPSSVELRETDGSRVRLDNAGDVVASRCRIIFPGHAVTPLETRS